MVYFKKMFKTGQITIPKEFRILLNINEGQYLFIHQCNKSIIIEKNHTNNTLNQCIFRNGKISIPKELRSQMGIMVDHHLKLQIKQEKIYITTLR